MDRYFDHAATTPVDPHVLSAMLPYFAEAYGNSHSLHSLGKRAMAAVDLAREQVALLIGGEDPSQIVFTSGATEAANQVLGGCFERIAISPFEHSAVREPAMYHGCGTLENTGYGLQSPTKACDLLAVMTVNNETGAILAVPDANPPPSLLRDITQQAGKLPVDVTNVDYATISAHKLYGPKGVGALYSHSGLCAPLLRGGDQEHGLRAGTLNVPGIVGFGEAARIALDRQPQDFEQAVELRAIVLNELRTLSEWRENRHTDQSPFILSLSFLGVEGEPLVHELDVRGFQVSSGAACSARSTEPSHVLSALKIEPEWLRGTLRVSFGRSNTCESARDLGRSIVESVVSVRKLRT